MMIFSTVIPRLHRIFTDNFFCCCYDHFKLADNIQNVEQGVNYFDLNSSFDTFIESIKMAGTTDWNLNDIDTSQFKCKFLWILMH